jgi:hypothetical protein
MENSHSMKEITPYIFLRVLKTIHQNNFNMWKKILKKINNLFDSKEIIKPKLEVPQKRYLIKEAKERLKTKV